MRSGIRVRITAAATVVVVAMLVATAIALLVSQRRALTEDVDDALRQRSSELAAAHDDEMLAGNVAGQGDEDAVAQVVGADGRVIAATANMADEPPLPAPPDGSRSLLRDTHLPADDSRYRLLSVQIGGLTIHTATPLDDIDESVATLRRSVSVAIPAVAAALAALVWLLVGRTLRPVEAIRAEVADITGASLHRRVPEPASRDEIARLAQTMNAMLDRVEAAAEKQRRFVADASHELRTPLARMRSELEVDLAHPGTADLRATHRSVLDETRNLENLVDDLLLLARSDGRAGPFRRVPVDLDDLVLAEAGRLRSEGRFTVDISGVSAGQVTGDPTELARAIRNLSENAARHAATAVAFGVTERDGAVQVCVSDDGPGIPESERARVFERFTRLDAARATSTGGAGLGLAITRAIVERHGGTLGIDPAHAPGARFVMSIPTQGD